MSEPDAMTPQQALDAADALLRQQSSGLRDSDYRIVPYRTKEFEDAFLFFSTFVDPTTGIPKRLCPAPAGGTPILVRKDGSPPESLWLYSDLSRQYCEFLPNVEHVVKVSSATDVAQGAKGLRDGLGLGLREALDIARSIVGGTPFERVVPDGPSGERAVAALKSCGVDAVLEERPDVVPKAYLGRPWPMPDWMPRMLPRIRAYESHLDLYLTGAMGYRDFIDGYYDIERDLDDAEHIESELIETGAREEWRAVRNGLCKTIVDLQLPFELEEPGGFQVVFEKKDEDEFRAVVAELRAAMASIVDRHGLTPERPTPLA